MVCLNSYSNALMSSINYSATQSCLRLSGYIVFSVFVSVLSQCMSLLKEHFLTCQINICTCQELFYWKFDTAIERVNCISGCFLTVSE